MIKGGSMKDLLLTQKQIKSIENKKYYNRLKPTLSTIETLEKLSCIGKELSYLIDNSIKNIICIERNTDIFLLTNIIALNSKITDTMDKIKEV